MGVQLSRPKSLPNLKDATKIEESAPDKYTQFSLPRVEFQLLSIDSTPEYNLDSSTIVELQTSLKSNSLTCNDTKRDESCSQNSPSTIIDSDYMEFNIPANIRIKVRCNSLENQFTNSMNETHESRGLKKNAVNQIPSHVIDQFDFVRRLINEEQFQSHKRCDEKELSIDKKINGSETLHPPNQVNSFSQMEVDVKNAKVEDMNPVQVHTIQNVNTHVERQDSDEVETKIPQVTLNNQIVCFPNDTVNISKMHLNNKHLGTESESNSVKIVCDDSGSKKSIFFQERSRARHKNVPKTLQASVYNSKQLKKNSTSCVDNPKRSLQKVGPHSIGTSKLMEENDVTSTMKLRKSYQFLSENERRKKFQGNAKYSPSKYQKNDQSVEDHPLNMKNKNVVDSNVISSNHLSNMLESETEEQSHGSGGEVPSTDNMLEILRVAEEYERSGNFELALKYYDKGLHYCQQLNETQFYKFIILQIRENLDALTKWCASQGQFLRAVQYARKLVSFQSELGFIEGHIHSLIQLAEMFRIQGMLEESIQCLKETADIQEREDRLEDLLKTLQKICHLYHLTKNPYASIFFDKSVEIQKRINLRKKKRMEKQIQPLSYMESREKIRNWYNDYRKEIRRRDSMWQ